MRPILVTGVPRSGNTWLARLLALSPGTALAGREPMNPRGRQYALGGSLDGWTRLTDASPYQRFLLRTAYQGWNPMVFSRFGARQWAGPLPQTRLVVKDPYALLSLRCVVAATGATPVLVYRHPGAVLASYRRVAWPPGSTRSQRSPAAPRCERSAWTCRRSPQGSTPVTAHEMGIFWSVLHGAGARGRRRHRHARGLARRARERR